MSDLTSKQKRLRAYYSLVQYCPDLARLEVANIGVVLFCPDVDYLDAKISSNSKRIAQMFGRGNRDLERLKVVRQGLDDKLKTSLGEVRSLQELNKLAALHVNTLQMTPFMPCRVSPNPKADLWKLFEDLVESDSNRAPNRADRLIDQLEQGFRTAHVERRIRRKVKVTIPVLGRDEEIPYAFQNGRLNLISPVVFPRTVTALEDKAAKYAVEGKSLFEHPHPEFGEMQMLVFGHFDSDLGKGIETAKRILNDNNVRLVRTEDMSELMTEIQQHAHDLTT